MAEPIRIRVGASADSSLTSVFRPFVEAAKTARKQVEEELNSLQVNIKQKIKVGVEGAAKTTETRLPAAAKTGTEQATKEVAKWEKAVDRLAKEAAREFEKAQADQVKAAARAEAEKTRLLERETRNRSRAEARAAAQAERAQKQMVRRRDRVLRQDGAGMAASTNVSTRAASFALDTATQLAGDLARGLGVNTDLSSMFKSGVDIEKQAADLSNAGYMPGASGANGQRQSTKALIAEARQIGNETAFDPTKVMEGLQGFVSKTGDLESGRSVMKEMAMLSRATGASMEDMASAAGDVSNGLGDIPNKGAKIAEVMRAAAAMGKEGAVEIKDLATQMAKLQAAASQHSGDPARNMSDAIAMAQMARAKGGAASATQAATGVGSFEATFAKGARLDQFEAKGIQVREKDGKTRRMRDIIVDSLLATNGDNREMGKLFADAGARRSVRGWETIFNEAGGGTVGADAVKRAFDKLSDATMNQSELTESFNASMNTTEARVQVFNNEMAKSADEIRSSLMPAVQELAPTFVRAASALATWVGKVTGKTDEDNDKKGKQNLIDAQKAENTLQFEAENGGVQKKDLDAAQGTLNDLDQSIAAKKQKIAENTWSGTRRTFEALHAAPGAVQSHDIREAEDKKQLAQMEKERDRLGDQLHKLFSQVLKVEVTNTEAMKPKPVPGGLPPNNPGAKGSPHAKVIHPGE